MRNLASHPQTEAEIDSALGAKSFAVGAPTYAFVDRAGGRSGCGPRRPGVNGRLCLTGICQLQIFPKTRNDVHE